MNSNKSLKIAVVVGVFPTVSETFITNQLLYLKNVGHQVDVFATRYIDTNDRFRTPDLINLLKTSYTFNRAGLTPKSKFKRLQKALQIFRKTKKREIDVDLGALAKKIAEGGGHPYAAGGKITDMVMSITKMLG